MRMATQEVFIERDEGQKINDGVGRKMIDVGWNPRWPIFHERSGSHEEHKEHEGDHEGEHEGKHEGNTKTNKNDHTCARSMNTKEDTRSTINKGRYTVTGSSPKEVLMGPPKMGLESKRIFSVEGPWSLSWSRSDMDERCSISNMSLHNANPNKEEVEEYI